MSYAYPFNRTIRDTYKLELFLYDNGFGNIHSIETNGEGDIVTINYNSALNESELTSLTQLVMIDYPNPYPYDNQNSIISMLNSSNTPLGVYSNFTGSYEDISKYTSVSVLINSDASSIKDGIELHLSTNGISADFTKKYTYTKNEPFVEMVSSVAKYFKIVFKNSGVAQTKFTLQVIYHTNRHPNMYSTTQETSVKIDEETNRKTKGRFRSHGFSVNALANTNTTHDFTFKYDIAPLVIKFRTNETHRGDIINLFIAPNVTIGALTQTANSGNNYFYITPASFDWLSIGCVCRITTGLVTNELGDVIDIDYSTGKVTVENNLSNTFSSGSFVQMSVSVMRNYIISEPGDHSIGDSKIGASFIPKGQIVRLVYTNNSNTDKLFVWSTEMLY